MIWINAIKMGMVTPRHKPYLPTPPLTKAEEPSLSYYLPIAGGWIIRFTSFLRVLVLCEMQLVSARIWTRVAVSISYDGKHYTMGTSSSTPYQV